ncbi:SDR family oxidoreductase [Pikeienuella piscinae]|uniref:SDR family oxidoreductase n=1 Tax=Pikeienuella piscinae TaxID=2748098 RepID=A0A7L5C1E9_9RHOB|nr:SDR family oxidoreductase [Pikeienuella piscinae]QIE56306.1 SDR family oxidoreductase [Pikeienuella piscinae]
MAEAMKTALVTGAARGIGLAIARRFLDEGWRVVMLDRAAETLEAARAAISSNAAHMIVADVSDTDDVARAMAETETLAGRLDALVNNAGVADFSPLLKTSHASWSEIMTTNLTGPFLTVNAAARLLARDGGGAVVNIGSISGLRASTLRVAYGTSKAALAHLTRQQAVELGEIGVRVNLVAPGPVETEMAKKVHSPAIRRDYRDAIPLARYGRETEIAAVVVFLSGDGASYVTGQTIAVDGGFDAAGIGLKTLRED